MKIAMFSDLHLGLSQNTIRKDEAYENASQAFKMAIEENSDAILLAGDLFDSNVPNQEVLSKAFDVFALPRKAKQSQVTLKIRKSSEIENRGFEGIPVIAIHGTHEFRGKEYTNVLDLYDKSSYLIYLHASEAIIEKGKDKLVVHGFSGVPEKKALDVLKLYNPQPVFGAKNILLLHQSFKEYLPFDDPMVATLGFENMPKGFDLIVNGHLHWTSQKNIGDTIFLLLGSTITTQMKNLESKTKKGIHFYDTIIGELTFKPLPIQRQLFYHKEKFIDATPEEIKEKCFQLVKQDLSQVTNHLEPMIRLKLYGTLKKGISMSDISLEELEKKYEGKVIFSISKDFYSQQFKSKIEELRKLQQSNKSIASLGLDILEKNLEETDFNQAFDARRIFSLLAEDKTEEVMELLSKLKENEEEYYLQETKKEVKNFKQTLLNESR